MHISLEDFVENNKNKLTRFTFKILGNCMAIYLVHTGFDPAILAQIYSLYYVLFYVLLAKYHSFIYFMPLNTALMMQSMLRSVKKRLS